MDKFEKNIEDKLKYNKSSKPKQDIQINSEKKMDIQNKQVIIDDKKIEGAMCQETDYNSDSLTYDSIRFKSEGLVRDFEVNGLFTIAFPWFFIDAYDFTLERPRPIKASFAVSKIMKRADNLVEDDWQIICHM